MKSRNDRTFVVKALLPEVSLQTPVPEVLTISLSGAEWTAEAVLDLSNLDNVSARVVK